MRTKIYGLVAVLLVVVLYPTSPAMGEGRGQLIVVDVINHRLYLYEIDCGSQILIKSFLVSTPKKGVVRPHGEGFVTGIVKNPWWYPTEETKKDYLKNGIVLPNAIPPGDKRNAMGSAKIILSHETSKGRVYRIHGTEDESSIGKDVSRGCIRMYNEDIKYLAENVVIGTKVIIN